MRKGWEYKMLGEVCCPKSKIQRATKCFGASDEIAYIDISSIDNSVQEVNSITSFTMSNAPSRAQQKVEYGDIIVSTVRPNLKNVALIKQHDSNLVASSGFCVLRTTDDIERNYLFRYITSDIFTQHLMKLTTGANYPAVRDLDVRDSTIPLPPKSTQLAIVSELDKINELIRLKKEQLKDFDNLAQSLFYEMFGDPVENEKGWEVKKLGDICTDITDGDHMPPPKSEFGIPFITISDIDKDTRCLNFENTFYVPEDYYNNLKENRKPQKGDLLYTVTGSYGIPVIVKTDKKFCFQRHIALLRPNKEILSTIFLCYWVLSDGVKFMADKVATGIAQKTVGLNSIRKFSCILPPLPLQHLFAQRIEQIEREKSEVQKSIQDLETLLASRMQYWFE